MVPPSGKPWFDSPHAGVGASLPVAWQGWALLASAFAAASASLLLLPGPAHTWASTTILSATWVAVCLKRAA